VPTRPEPSWDRQIHASTSARSTKLAAYLLGGSGFVGPARNAVSRPVRLGKL
jgi:hypothetical protein